MLQIRVPSNCLLSAEGSVLICLSLRLLRTEIDVVNMRMTGKRISTKAKVGKPHQEFSRNSSDF